MHVLTSLFFAASSAVSAFSAVDSLPTGRDIIPLPSRVEVGIGSVDGECEPLLFLNSRMAPESYRLDISEEGVMVEAADSAGMRHACSTLRQLRRLSPDSLLRCQVIEDSPRFPYRGMHVDVSRHFRSIDFLKKQIDAFSDMKINRLHLHLTDAAGWRLEVREFPLLTQYAAWRPQSRWRDWTAAGSGYCKEGSPGAYGGYYTACELRDLVGYALERGIEIIPEIEMPGHSAEVTAVYPEFSCNGAGGDLCPGKEATYGFIFRVLDTVMDIFPSHLIHIGGDEADMSPWESCGDCRGRMLESGISTPEGLQSYMMGRIGDYLVAHGRRPIVWDEVTEGGLSDGAVVMSWRSPEAGFRAMEAGHDVVMTPVGYCYLDYNQDAPFLQPESMGGYLPLERVYGFGMLPENMVSESSSRLLGLQGSLWAEYIEDESHAEYMYYPRAFAIAELGWSGPGGDYADFRRRALALNNDLKNRGYSVFPLESEYGERPEALDRLGHMAVGRNVIYNVEYDGRYPGGGVSTLTDGQRGGWAHGDGRWQGWLEDLDVTVDLGAVMPIRYAGADFMHSDGAWIHLPEEVEIFLSSDGESYEDVGRIHTDIDPSYPKIMMKEFGLPLDAEARYVRFKARKDPRPGTWLFLSELIVN